MSLTYTANTDFNGDGNFSECELDASWATLQVKKLLETSGTTTIEIGGTSFNVTNNDTFLEAVKAMVALNVSASIASDGCAVVSSLPVEVSVDYGPLELSNVLGYWRMNEQGPDYDATAGRSARIFPLYDSSNFKNNADINKAAVQESDVSEKIGLGLYNWSDIKIPDSSGQLFSNTTDWTFHVKLFLEDDLSFMIKKGNFKIPFNNPAFYVTCASGVKVINYPDGLNPFSFKNTLIDLFLIKEGDLLRLEIIDESNVTHSFGQIKAGQGLFDSSSVNADIEILGKGSQPGRGTRNELNFGIPFLSEMYVTSRPEPTLSQNFYLPSTFRLLYNGDTDDTTYESDNWKFTKTNEQLTINGNVPIRGGLQSSGSYTFANTSGDANYITYNNFDLTQDFTFSFYYRRWGNAPEIVSILDSGGNGLKLSLTNQLYFSFNSSKGSMNKNATSNEDMSSWHHLTIVKSNGRIAFFIDGEPKLQGYVLQYRSGDKVTDSLDTGLTNCTLKIGGHNNSPVMNISDICLIQGGVIRVNNAWQLGVANDNSTILKIKDRSYFA
jgi:hypothetical protein